ncbi:MAG: asparaginase [Alphaproteobacteria bacterium]|nr:MAG: asparaginase [Alphaproteobacteria bacterium]
MANPVLVEVTRDPEGGRFVESRHRGAIAIVDRSGDLVFSIGDVEALTCPRSAFKSMQALPMIEAGGVDAYQLGPQEIALACASHGGQSQHVSRVEDWLKKIDCSVADLECGPHLPSHVPSAHALISEGRTPTRAHNNCSGKHAGFLTLARLMNAPTKGYVQPDHPVQQRVQEVISELVDFQIADHPTGADGCCAPNYQMPLKNLALGMSRLANPDLLAPHRQGAVEVMLEALSNHSFFMAGDDRACTALTQGLSHVGFVKIGAEGVYTGCFAGIGLGLALKIDDGAKRGAEVAVAQLLARMNLLGAVDQLRDWLEVPIRNTCDKKVGSITVSQEWEKFNLPIA